MEDVQLCQVCGVVKPLKAFKRVDKEKVYVFKTCMSCYDRRRRLKARKRFLELYGGICVCCGQADPRFLSIDHINNDGYKHRERIDDRDILTMAARHHRPDIFQILCFNCNMGKERNGGVCPHKAEPLEEYLAKIDKILDTNRWSAASKTSRGEGLIPIRKQKTIDQKQKVIELMSNLSKEEMIDLLARLGGSS